MYRHLKVIAIAPAFNEELKMGTSSDEHRVTLSTRCWSWTTGPLTSRRRSLEACGATVLTMDRTIGVGAALRLGYRYAVSTGSMSLW